MPQYMPLINRVNEVIVINIFVARSYQTSVKNNYIELLLILRRRGGGVLIDNCDYMYLDIAVVFTSMPF